MVRINGSIKSRRMAKNKKEAAMKQFGELLPVKVTNAG